MENVVYLDTHIVCWLYSGQLEFLSEKAKKLIEDNELLISPMVILELQYLLEINRIIVSPIEIFNTLQKEVSLKTCDLDFPLIINKAIEANWTRDPFDRIITSHASINNAILVTKDHTILSNYSKAIWA